MPRKGGPVSLDRIYPLPPAPSFSLVHMFLVVLRRRLARLLFQFAACAADEYAERWAGTT